MTAGEQTQLERLREIGADETIWLEQSDDVATGPPNSKSTTPVAS
jgi:hypothetical protein